MNKEDMVKSVMAATGQAKAEAEKSVDAVFSAISETLKSGGEVRLAGFGTFVVSARAARDGRNPRTGETIKIPGSKAVRFRPGKGLKDAVN